jgi:glutaredoxin
MTDFYIMNKPKIVAYLKPSCGWSQGVRAIMRKYDLPFEDRDIINDPLQRQEMIEKSGQMLSPCVEVNGKMLPDISGEEVEAYLLANKSGRQHRPRSGRSHQPALRPRNAAVGPASVQAVGNRFNQKNAKAFPSRFLFRRRKMLTVCCGPNGWRFR